MYARSCLSPMLDVAGLVGMPVQSTSTVLSGLSGGSVRVESLSNRRRGQATSPARIRATIRAMKAPRPPPFGEVGGGGCPHPVGGAVGADFPACSDWSVHACPSQYRQPPPGAGSGYQPGGAVVMPATGSPGQRGCRTDPQPRRQGGRGGRVASCTHLRLRGRHCTSAKILNSEPAGCHDMLGQAHGSRATRCDHPAVGPVWGY